METVVDPEGIVYVAGYDQETPHRDEVTKPGRVRVRHDSNGDGRVPHDLGLLDGVRTLWVDEVHGDLAGNASVLAGIHSCSRQATRWSSSSVARVATTRARRQGSRPSRLTRRRPVQKITATGVPVRGRKPLDVPENTERAEALLVRGFVGSPTERGAGRERPSDAERYACRRPGRKPRTNR